MAGPLPHPFTPADRRAGYRYDLSVLQAVLPHPDAGPARLGPVTLGDPPGEAEVVAAVVTIAAQLDRAVAAMPTLADTGSGPRRLVGLAGTVSTLASLELGLVAYDRERIHHSVLSLESVARWCEILALEPVAVRAQRPGLPAGRQDVIFGGALILREVMVRFDFGACIVSESDILDGLIMSLRRGSPPQAGPA